MKKIIALVLAVAMLLPLPMGEVKAAGNKRVVASGQIGDITWQVTNVYEETEGYIEGCILDISGSGAIPDYQAPNADHSNTSVIAPWLVPVEGSYDGGYFTEINIGSGITYIGRHAFSPYYLRTNYIDSIVIPDTVTEIAAYAFLNQEYVTYVQIPDSVTAIGTSAFSAKPTIICSSKSEAFTFARTRNGNRVNLTDIQITLTLGSKKTAKATLQRGESISYTVTCNLEGITPTVSIGSQRVKLLTLDTEKQKITVKNDPSILDGGTFAIRAEAYGCSAVCQITVPSLHTVQYWGDALYTSDLGTDTYIEGTTFKLTKKPKKKGYIFDCWCTQERIWSSDDGCFILKYTKATEVDDSDRDSDGIVNVFAFWKRDIADATITVSVRTYTGSAVKPKPTVVCDGKTLVRGTDYTASYKNNIAIGKATVTIKGKGGYGGSKNKTFKINPAKTSISSVKNTAAKTITVKWKKGKASTGYEIQYSLKSSFKDAKKKTIKTLKTTSTKITKLKKGKTYYVRIRVYKTVSGKKYYSAWSTKVKVKVTK